jgi:hypothetical protein
MAAIIIEERTDMGGGDEHLTLWVRYGFLPNDRYPFYDASGAAPVSLPNAATVKAGLDEDGINSMAAGLDYGWNRAEAIEYALVQDGNAGDPGYLTNLRSDMVILLNILRA